MGLDSLRSAGERVEDTNRTCAIGDMGLSLSMRQRVCEDDAEVHNPHLFCPGL